MLASQITMNASHEQALETLKHDVHTVLIVSDMPPPPGGNAVHAERLRDCLVQDGLEVINWEPQVFRKAWRRSLWAAWKQLRVFASQVDTRDPGLLVHVHVSAIRKFLLVAPLLRMFLRRQPRVVTIHSGSFVELAQSQRRKLAVDRVLGGFHHIINVNREQQALLTQRGFDPESLSVVPAFLPISADARRLPEGWRPRRAGRKRVITSGYLTPLYDHEVLADAISELPPEEFEFVFAFYNQADPDYERVVLDKLKPHANVQVYRDEDAETFVAMLADSDIYVRMTTADGDAVAIREALDLGVPVIATDCVARPAACRLLPTSDAGALVQALNRTPSANAIPQAEPGADPVSVKESNYTNVLRAYHLAASRLAATQDVAMK